jgi:hypothetical protein
MNASILCPLIAKRIDPTHFQLWGLDIHWMNEEYNTPENRAIVEDVIKNYDILAGDAEKSAQESIEKEALIQAKIREQAITALKVEGKLDKDGLIAKVKL